MKNSLFSILSVSLILSQLAAVPVRADSANAESQKRELQEVLTKVSKKLPDGTRMFSDEGLNQEMDVKNLIFEGLPEAAQAIFIPMKISNQEIILKILPKEIQGLVAKVSVGFYLAGGFDEQHLLSGKRISINFSEKLENTQKQFDTEIQDLTVDLTNKISLLEKSENSKKADRSTAKNALVKIQKALMVAFSSIIPSAHADDLAITELRKIKEILFSATIIVMNCAMIKFFKLNKNGGSLPKKIYYGLCLLGIASSYAVVLVNGISD